jgi:two-component system NtrC family response regulator/two-component system nitrogen regulation response regulator GlnG
MSRVLVVDDELLIRWSLAEILRDEGHEVVGAANGREALAAVADAGVPFDVVLLDFRLPDSSDLGLLAYLRLRLPKASIIMMTAFGTPEMLQQAIELGAYRVIGKPFEIPEMAALVVEARDRAHR